VEKNKIVLLSHIYSNSTPSYGNRDLFKTAVNSSINLGDSSNTSCWIFSNNHLGTHIDVPFHFVPDGAKITDIPAGDWLFNKVGVIDIPCKDAKLIAASDFEACSIDPNIELLLIRTQYEKYREIDKYWNDNPGLSPEVADYLRRNFRDLRCIGFDFISITSWKHRPLGGSSHKAFLSSEKGRPILAIEDMSFKKLDGEIDWVLVSPVFVENENGAPVTVFANTI
jgi:arylformamidase